MNLFKVAITTGDQDGIGPEVAAKALAQKGPCPGTVYFLWRSPSMSKKWLKLIDQKFQRHTVNSWPEAQKATIPSSKTLIDICCHHPPAHWVEAMGKAGALKQIDALVTGPLSKTSILAANMKDIGHTEILARVTKTPNVFMTFLGEKFNVVLLTGHFSLTKAYGMIDKKRLQVCAHLANSLKASLDPKSSKKPIGLLGANPHSGEQGLIGSVEKTVYNPVLRAIRKKGLAIEGPLVPDVAFQEKYWNQYALYIASYHDQGLIPFKMIHCQSGGLQLSLGLPFVRTSVDHGTAKDLFGKNKANPASMARALLAANRLIRGKKLRW